MKLMAWYYKFRFGSVACSTNVKVFPLSTVKTKSFSLLVFLCESGEVVGVNKGYS